MITQPNDSAFDLPALDQWKQYLAEMAVLKKQLSDEREKYEELVEAARGLSYGVDWNNGTHAKLHGYRQKLLDALKKIDSTDVEGKGKK